MSAKRLVVVLVLAVIAVQAAPASAASDHDPAEFSPCAISGGELRFQADGSLGITLQLGCASSIGGGRLEQTVPTTFAADGCDGAYAMQVGTQVRFAGFGGFQHGGETFDSSSTVATLYLNFDSAHDTLNGSAALGSGQHAVFTAEVAAPTAPGYDLCKGDSAAFTVKAGALARVPAGVPATSESSEPAGPASTAIASGDRGEGGLDIETLASAVTNSPCTGSSRVYWNPTSLIATYDGVSDLVMACRPYPGVGAFVFLRCETWLTSDVIGGGITYLESDGALSADYCSSRSRTKSPELPGWLFTEHAAYTIAIFPSALDKPVVWAPSNSSSCAGGGTPVFGCIWAHPNLIVPFGYQWSYT